MLKNILKLEGAQELNKREQQVLTGGAVFDCSNEADGTACIAAESGELRTCYLGVCYDC